VTGHGLRTIEVIRPVLAFIVVQRAHQEVPVGDGRAAVVGSDPEVDDDSWVEVFQSVSGLAIVQASQNSYPCALAAALGYPDAEDDDGEILLVPSGQIAIFSAAGDGTGKYSVPLAAPDPGPVPRGARAAGRRQTPACCCQPRTPPTSSRCGGAPISTTTAASRAGSWSRNRPVAEHLRGGHILSRHPRRGAPELAVRHASSGPH